MNPILNDGEFVFVSVDNTTDIDISELISVFHEKEGTTLIMSRKKADELGFNYELIAAWITLEVHSDLGAVGLTAAFSNALAECNISCNVVAGFYHDHIFVDHKDRNKAMKALLDLKTTIT